MGRVQKKVAQKKRAQQPTQCTGTTPRWATVRSEQQLLLKSAPSASKVYAVTVPDSDIGCRNEELSGRLSHSLSGSKQNTADEGVAVCSNEHQVTTGDHSCSVENEQCSTNCEFSDERPITITDEISLVASPHANSEQVIRQEVTHPQFSKICTGLHPLPLPPTYHSIHSSQPLSAKNDYLQLPMLNNLPDFECNDQTLKQVSQVLISESERSEEPCYYADMQRGPLYMSKTFYQHSIQETFQRPAGNQELVLSHSITFYQSSHTHKSLHYMHTERSALERTELYIKPFIVLAPE